MGRFIGKEHPPGVLIGFLLRIRKDNSRKANLTPIALHFPGGVYHGILRGIAGQTG